jgi:hypothetical protein
MLFDLTGLIDQTVEYERNPASHAGRPLSGSKVKGCTLEATSQSAQARWREARCSHRKRFSRRALSDSISSCVCRLVCRLVCQALCLVALPLRLASLSSPHALGVLIPPTSATGVPLGGSLESSGTWGCCITHHLRLGTEMPPLTPRLV